MSGGEKEKEREKSLAYLGYADPFFLASSDLSTNQLGSITFSGDTT